MNAHTVCLLFLIALQRCTGSTLRASSVDSKENQRERELHPVTVTNQNLYSSPLNYAERDPNTFQDFGSHVLAPIDGSYTRIYREKFTVAYSEVFRIGQEGNVDSDLVQELTCAKLLALFSPLFVEQSGEVFTVVNDEFEEFLGETVDAHGLYQVTSDSGPETGFWGCHVTFRLLYEDDSIGRIVPSTGKFGDIRIIAVDKENNKIYGYYFDYCQYYPDDYVVGCGLGFPVWARKATIWGDAIDGTLVTEPTNNDERSGTSGISMNGRLFNLWGDFNNFNYAKHDDVRCWTDPENAFYFTQPPAIIDDWSGDHAGKRGTYCPGADTNKQLKKYTWHQSGSTIDDLSWVPAARLGRLSPTSNIYGVSADGSLLNLWHKRSENVVHAAGLDILQMNIRSIGAGEPGYARGFFVSNDENRIFNVYWENSWKMKEMDSMGSPYVSVFFGYYNDHAYVLESKFTFCGVGCYGGPELYQTITRYDFVGGSERYESTIIGIYFCDFQCPIH